MPNIVELNQMTNVVTEKMVDDYLFGTETKLSESQKVLFKNIAIQNNLNPFLREIYAIPYEKTVTKDGKKFKETVMTIVTGYQVYIQRAEETGLLKGWYASLIKEGNEIKGAKIIINRADWNIPFEWEVSFDEFAKRDYNGNLIGSWANMPGFMILKCVIGTGFRLCFSTTLGKLPYLAEEMSSLTFEEVQQKEKELMTSIANAKRELMSKETKKELLSEAEDVNIIYKAIDNLKLDRDRLYEDQKEEILEEIKKLKGLLDENVTE
jgi:hypothetical protein